MFVKICGITTADDALLSIALGADAVGFVFAPSTRQLAPARAVDIVRQLPAEALSVGVFRDEAPERIVHIANQTGVRAVQLHGGETPNIVAYVKAHVPVVIKSIVAGSEDLQHADRYGADAILVDAPTPGSGQIFDWSLAEDTPAGMRMIMAGGLDPENVATAIAKVKPWGVDVSSGVERSAGTKDIRLLRAFIDKAKAAHRPSSRPGPESDMPYDWEESAR